MSSGFEKDIEMWSRDMGMLSQDLRSLQADSDKSIQQQNENPANPLSPLDTQQIRHSNESALNFKQVGKAMLRGCAQVMNLTGASPRRK